MTSGRVVTEHDILPGAWYLDCNRIPTCIAVEAGQADLFLSGWLGIDFETKGVACYRLLDAVVTFHRVLDRSDCRFATALNKWTLDCEAFDCCLAELRAHYNVVSLDAIRAARSCGGRLPARPLLITFDDGYADAYDYALPIMRRHDLPGVLFVSSDVVGQRRQVWTEEFLWLYESGGVSRQTLRELHRLLFGRSAPALAPQAIAQLIVRAGPEICREQANAVLTSLGVSLPAELPARQMLIEDEIRALVVGGIAIGAHGKSHVSLTATSDLSLEIRAPRLALDKILAPVGARVDAFSLPYGAYVASTLEALEREDYDLVFTVDEALCALERGQLRSRVLGRVGVEAPQPGQSRDEWLASLVWRLVTRPRMASGRRIAAPSAPSAPHGLPVPKGLGS